MKIKMLSGEKEFKFNHKAIYNFKKITGKDIMTVFEQEENTLTFDMLYNIMFSGMCYETIEDMLDDMLDDEFQGYIDAITEGLAKLFGGPTKNTNQKAEKSIIPNQNKA